MEELKLNLKKEFLDKGYLICDKIGEGGCSYIYKAQRIKTRIHVAIKILKLSPSYSKLTKLKQKTYFKQSNSFYDYLQHSSIVICLEKGELNNGVSYAIFEYIPGETLKQFLIARTKISAFVIATIMSKVLNALAYSHSKGIVHGDLKPHNIMIFGSGKVLHVKLIDFVFYKPFDGFKSSEHGFLSPQYNSPEQLKGHPPTPHSDLYSWALIFLECLNGTPVISGNSINEITRNHLNGKERIIPQEICNHPLGNIFTLALNKEVSRSGGAQYLLEELSKLDFSTLPDCRIYYQQNVELNIDNTILTFPK